MTRIPLSSIEQQQMANSRQWEFTPGEPSTFLMRVRESAAGPGVYTLADDPASMTSSFFRFDLCYHSEQAVGWRFTVLSGTVKSGPFYVATAKKNFTPVSLGTLKTHPVTGDPILTKAYLRGLPSPTLVLSQDGFSCFEIPGKSGMLVSPYSVNMVG